MWLGRRLFPSRLALLLLLFLIGALNFVLWQVVTLLWILIMLMREVVFFYFFDAHGVELVGNVTVAHTQVQRDYEDVQKEKLMVKYTKTPNYVK